MRTLMMFLRMYYGIGRWRHYRAVGPIKTWRYARGEVKGTR